MGSPADDTASAVLRVSADGADWRDVSAPLLSVEVEDHDRLTDKATIVFEDASSILAHLSFVGVFVTVAFGWRDATQRIFAGQVTGERVLATPSGQTVELTALDHSTLMTRRGYDPMEWRPGEKLSEVLRRLVSRPEYHLRPGQIEPVVDHVLDERRPARPANLSEWGFVLDQAARQGCLAFVEFDGESRSRFYFVPLERVARAEPVGTLRYCRGVGELIEFEYERVGAGPPTLEASTIDPDSGAPIDHRAPPSSPRSVPPPPVPERDPDLGQSRRDAVRALAELTAVADAALTTPRRRVSGTPGGTATELDRRASPDPTRSNGMRGRGLATGSPALRAKSRIRVVGVAPWAEGEWYLSRVNHVYRRDRAGLGTRTSYFTRFVASR